jgi:hypothetical protein
MRIGNRNTGTNHTLRIILKYALRRISPTICFRTTIPPTEDRYTAALREKQCVLPDVDVLLMVDLDDPFQQNKGEAAQGGSSQR